MPTNYKNGKIYTIRSPNTDKVYVGSTCSTLSKRLYFHKLNHTNGKSQSTTSFKIFEFGNAYIELVEKFPCDCKTELHKREGHFIRTMNSVNRCISGRTVAEYLIDNKELIKQKEKAYRTLNKEKLQIVRKKHYNDHLEENQKYRDENKDKFKKWRDDNKDILKIKSKEYRTNNKEKLSLRQKEAYENNKEKYIKKSSDRYAKNKDAINEKRRNAPKITCTCGQLITKPAMKRHLNSAKHKEGL